MMIRYINDDKVLFSMITPHLILQKFGKILLIRRHRNHQLYPAHWHCLSGKIEQNESPTETLVRECQEEIGVHIAHMDHVTTIFCTGPDHFIPEKQFRSIEIFFMTSIKDTDHLIHKEPDKHDAVEWFRPDTLPTPMIPQVAQGLVNAFSGQSYSTYNNPHNPYATAPL